jgi:hypothetical protein
MIHRVRLAGLRRGETRSAQGSYEMEQVTGPWIAARVMERGGVAGKSRRGSQQAAERVDRGYELLIDTVDMVGGAPVELTASAVLETDCPVLGNPVVQLSGDPEVLNNGSELIGFLAYGDAVKDRG